MQHPMLWGLRGPTKKKHLRRQKLGKISFLLPTQLVVRLGWVDGGKPFSVFPSEKILTLSGLTQHTCHRWEGRGWRNDAHI